MCLEPERGCPTRVQEREAAMFAGLQGVTEYFGEEYSAQDPARILRVVRDFVLAFDKALADIAVRC